MPGPISILGLEIVGIEHTSVEIAVYMVGWMIGWLLLWRPRHLAAASPPPPGRSSHDLTGTSSRPPIAVVIPARDEASALPNLLRPLVAQQRAGDEIVVVDDHSGDGTARIAELFDATVITPPEPPEGWLGKPNACWHGALATSAPLLVFLDADVRPGPTLLDDLAGAIDDHPGELVSMQPWHEMETLGEQPSILCNVTALMGCGAFTAFGQRATATVAFGPVIALERATYDAVGGHGDPGVRGMHTEDIGLARAVGSVCLFVGSQASTTFRMYPDGFGALVRGWTRSLATGARFTSWWLALLTLLWVWSLAGGWIAAPAVYPLTAIQVWVLGRRAGTIHPIAALCFPVLVVVFVVIFVRSTFAVVFRRDVTWKRRHVAANQN